jgi:ferredoxin-NADP reductase/MOSC domain-containing protein YiiM/ferredoxin
MSQPPDGVVDSLAIQGGNVARLLSVNVGLPREIEWKGRAVRTGIWKEPVPERCWAGRLNLAGDGQGDLAGHGGEQRAVFVYQIESYRHWQAQLKRTDFAYGQFGENFTVKGLADSSVCIGDRYRIGSALFEVTQPRVTCYRVGIRTNEPRMPALLTSSGRPGFYFRVLEEGTVGAGDDIVKVGEASERMTVVEINALLYSTHHPRDRLERALRIDALSPGWRRSFEAMLRGPSTGAISGNAGLAPAAAAHPVAPGFRPLTVTAIERASADVLSLTLTLPGTNGERLQAALPGQYVALRLPRPTGGAPLIRSYSLSGAASTERYRISVKIEPGGAAGSYLQNHVHVGDTLEVSAPRGNFVLQPGDGPVVLLSAGIGVTPVLAMLHALVASGSTRHVWWLHGARDHQHHAFADEARELVYALVHGRSYVCYSQPDPGERIGEDVDAKGHLSRMALDELGVPREADFYLCGPPRFLSDMKTALTGLSDTPDRIHTETFNGREALTPGIAVGTLRAPHLPEHDSDTGPLVSFSRSGVAAHWNAAAYPNILELAEACDVPVRWACRAGVCHNCESGLVSGAVSYGPEPLERPAQGNVLVCCAQPVEDVVIDL